jgi:D-glycero-D-manno-heptose 1,7-bisphosphate phosphatase
VHGASLGADPRMAHAAYGLALRGHDVVWRGQGLPDGSEAAAPESLRTVRRAREARGVDLVLGSSSPIPVAATGWLAGAHGLVMSVTDAGARRWNAFQRLAWESLPQYPILDQAPAEDASLGPDERIEARHAVWSAEPIPAVPDVTHPDVEVLERSCERLLARRHGRTPRRAVFLDRDGTLVVERGYLSHPDDLELLPGVGESLRQLGAAGYARIVVSNQSGVGRGLFPLSRVYEAMARLRALLRASGVELDAVYFCPHRPDSGCACRKPGTELLLTAARDLQLSLRGSAMIGDKLLDAETGQRAGALGILVRTGYGRDEERRLVEGTEARAPDRVVETLAEAAAWLAARSPAVTGE